MDSLQSKYSEDGPERCGFILSDDSVIEVENKCPEPTMGFVIDPADIVAHEDKIVGTWHTHPGADANLSIDDYITFLNWQNYQHYVIGRDGIRSFTVKKGKVVEA